jgi:predicted nucleic acid-binding protein
MIITLDVSAAIELVMGLPKQSIIKSELENADLIISPSLYIYEASNAMWKYNKIKNYPENIIMHKIRHTLELIDQFVDANDIYEEAISMSCKIDHPVYDTMYLITCRRKNGYIMSLDSRLVKAAKKTGISVINI